MRPHIRTTLAAIVLTTAAASASLLLRSAETAPRAPAPTRVERTVVMDGTAFGPPEVTVEAGTTIVWRNDDPFPHNVSSESGGFESDDLPAGGQFRFETRARGTFPYECTLHPRMRGVIHVR